MFAPLPSGSDAREIIDWFDSHPEHQVVDQKVDAAFDTLVERFGSSAAAV